MKKFFALALLAITCLINQVSLAALPSTIHFAMEATYPPFEYMDPSGQIRGFDVDIAKALCTEMKVQCSFSHQPWDSLIPSLKLGKFDALISAMAITDERKQQVDFSIPYFATTGSFIGLAKSNLSPTPESLKGKIIGVQSGTVFETYLKTKYPGVKIKSYASAQDAFLDLTSGRIDALLADTPIVIDWLHKNSNSTDYALIGEPINDPQVFGVGYGIAVRKNQPELLAAFNKAIMAIRANGTYEKIAHANFDKH